MWEPPWKAQQKCAILFILLWLKVTGQKQDASTQSVGPVVLGLRVEFSSEEVGHDGGPVMGYKNHVIQVHENQPIMVRLFGQNLDETEYAFFVKSENCSVAYRIKPVDFDIITDLSLAFKISFPDEFTLYSLCIAWKDGENIVTDFYGKSQMQITTEVPPRKYYLPFWIQVIVICCLLVLSGLFSGLNLGLMALGPNELELIIKSGTKNERCDAEIILPVRKSGNYLLCSLLLGNVIVNSGISILFDNLTSGFVALAVSSLGIVIFGEIIPQSICVKKGLAVGARTIWITRFFMIITFPMSYPVSKLLDLILGSEAGVVYNKERLIEMIKISIGQQVGMGDEFLVVSGALEYTKKTVKDVMTKIEDAFMLPSDTVLNMRMIADVIRTGYTRIPVYEGDRNQVVALLNVKDLALLDPDDNLTVRTICSYWDHPVRFIIEDTPLKVMLDEFKKGHYHLALVQRIEEPEDGDNFYSLVGIVTLEDIIEEILQAEIVDETDAITDNVKKKRRNDAQLKDLSRLLQQESTIEATISPQLQLAAIQWLSSNFAPFHEENITNAVVQRLVKQNGRLERPSQLIGIPNKFLYKKQEPSDKFILILEGRLEVTIGKGNLKFEAGPFHYFGAEVLTRTLEVAPSLTQPSMSFSRQSLPSNELLSSRTTQLRKMATFVPDFEVIVKQDVTYLQISAGSYLSAFRASLIERGKPTLSMSRHNLLGSPSSDELKGSIGRGRERSATDKNRTESLSSPGSRNKMTSGNSMEMLKTSHESLFSRDDANRATIGAGTNQEARKLVSSMRRMSGTDSNLPRSISRENIATDDNKESYKKTAESPSSNHSRTELIVRMKEKTSSNEEPV